MNNVVTRFNMTHLSLCASRFSASLGYVKWAVFLTGVRASAGGRLISMNGSLAAQQDVDVHLQLWRSADSQDGDRGTATYTLVYDYVLSGQEELNFEVHSRLFLYRVALMCVTLVSAWLVAIFVPFYCLSFGTLCQLIETSDWNGRLHYIYTCSQKQL